MLAEAQATLSSSSNPYGFDCSALERLPGHGNEIILIASLFLFLLVTWSIVYADIMLKQWMPSLVDPLVLARVAEVQQQFPNLKLSEEEKEHLYEEEENLGDVDDESDKKEGEEENIKVPQKSHYAVSAEDGSLIKYDSVSAAEAYISTKTVDLDLLTSFVNSTAYSTMSEYSADTTRGYNMLTATLAAAAFVTTFLCIINFFIDTKAGKKGWLDIEWGVISLYFYPFIFCTSIVMTSASSTVFRDSNILLFTNMPYKIDIKGKLQYNPLRHLHVFGVVLFGLPPIICHIIQMTTWGKTGMPNYDSAQYLMLVALVGVLLFALGGAWSKYLKGTKLVGNKISITGENIMMMGCFLSFVHWEAYAAMYCSGNEKTWNYLIVGAFVLPYLFVAKDQYWRPTSYEYSPSLLLRYRGEPTGVIGDACPAQVYHGSIVPGTTQPKAKLHRVK